MKRPAFQFYPADWRKDVELQSCSMAAQGLWINAMCIAHECDPYGHLTVNGKGMTTPQLARQVGLGAKEAQSLIDELIDAGVARRTADATLYSKRMVDDEDLRNRRAAGGATGAEHGIKGAEAGIKGGRPAGRRGDKKPPLNPPPSSSLSSSPSGFPPAPPPGGSDVPSGKANTSNSITVPSNAGKATQAYIAELDRHTAESKKTPEEVAALVAAAKAKLAHKAEGAAA